MQRDVRDPREAEEPGRNVSPSLSAAGVALGLRRGREQGKWLRPAIRRMAPPQDSGHLASCPVGGGGGHTMEPSLIQPLNLL